MCRITVILYAKRGFSVIHVSIKLVDGGLQEITEDDRFISQLKILKNQGYGGKELIHQLITDDWSAPPVYIDINGTTSNGSVINIRIPYN